MCAGQGQQYEPLLNYSARPHFSTCMVLSITHEPWSSCLPVPPQRGERNQAESALQEFSGTLACVMPVQRTEESWRAWKASTALFKHFKGLASESAQWAGLQLPSSTAKGWRAESALLRFELWSHTFSAGLLVYKLDSIQKTRCRRMLPIWLHCPLGKYKAVCHLI